MNARTHISEVVLCTASQNVDSHPILCAIQELSLSSTESACKSQDNLLDFDEYMGVEL